MKIAVASDIHLEFGPITLTNEENADVLILSGDICVAADVKPKHDSLSNLIDRFKRSENVHVFFENCCKEFKNVLYVMGNHEYYHGDYATTIRHLKDCLLPSNPNLHIMDIETLKIDDITFIGGSLWTDMNREDPISINTAMAYMNDFRQIKNSLYSTNGRFLPQDTIDEHKAMLRYIEQVIAASNPEDRFVVVGHHAPSKVSTHPRYKDDFHINGCYSSNLDEFILDNRQIKLWTHGHTHHTFDYLIGTTRIVCNPRGYDGYEDRADQFVLKYVEV